VRNVLARSGAPSASIAVVRDGAIVLEKAYGHAHITPPMTAAATMRYSIGSVSKQFTATAVLLLAERRKLSLDDKVSRWLPELTRANDVTVRQVLSMTSGYQDYWPQDYVMPPMLKSTTAQEILNEWAKKPLDFEPGSQWQYSNTNYVIAGRIVEKASGIPLVDFLRKEIFTPLHMESVVITDDQALGPTDPERHQRNALGPARVAPKEGKGWLFAAGELAMTASDLARWDISVMNQKVLTPASYRTQQTSVLLANGTSTGYGLGVFVGQADGHRLISHTGEVSGFTTSNSIYLDDHTAVVVLTNLFLTDASDEISSKIAGVLFRSNDAATRSALQQAKAIFAGLQRGKVDRSLFSANANAYFSAEAVGDFASSLAPLGAPAGFTQTALDHRGGMVYREFRIQFAKRAIKLTTYMLPDGKLEQYLILARPAIRRGIGSHVVHRSESS
jgi:D-alanyl-D-alanine carboxypeptidase